MGLGVFVVTTIARDVSIVQVYRRVLPFVVADFIRLAALTAFPGITLILVRLLN
jgi:TRAP-type C4-dicarboxylate transport system permease large subunit